jgi:hypothetical protein
MSQALLEPSLVPDGPRLDVQAAWREAFAHAEPVGDRS